MGNIAKLRKVYLILQKRRVQALDRAIKAEKARLEQEKKRTELSNERIKISQLRMARLRNSRFVRGAILAGKTSRQVVNLIEAEKRRVKSARRQIKRRR